jgi:hypothetical protein
MSKRKTPLIGFLFLVLAGSVLPTPAPQFNQFVNYSSVLQVNDFAIDGNVLWIASSGGLYRYDCTAKNGTLYTDPAKFPDLNLTSLCIDSNHTLWIGTNRGYLYERSTQGNQGTYSAYFTAGWQITHLLSYSRYLVIGSNKGCSVFDTVSHDVINNAPGFGPGVPSPQVYSMAIYRDTLLLGCMRGLAKLFVGNSGLQTANFFDPSIWTIDSSLSFSVLAIIVGGNGYQGLPSLTAMLNGHQVSCAPNEDTTINLIAQGVIAVDGNAVMTLPSYATTIKADTVNGRRRCLIGTLYNYFYFWDGSDTVNSPIVGPTFSNVTKVYVDKEGLTWVCPNIQDVFRSNDPWWEGISVFRNNLWQVYSPAKYPSMGGLGGPPDAIEAANEDLFGRMWFGTPGGQVKRYDRVSDSWLEYCPGCQESGNGAFTSGSICTANPNSWGLCDAISLDSAGFMWFTSCTSPCLYYSAAQCIGYGALLCYDPRYAPNTSATTPALAHYRYFFPQSDTTLSSENYGVMCVDAANDIVLGEGFLTSTGKFLVISYSGSPLTSNINIKCFNTNKGMIFNDAVATRDSLTFLATSAGIYTYSAADSQFQRGLRCLLPNNASYNGSDSLIDTTLTGIQALALQDNRYLWLGTLDSGLIRYDLTSGTRTTIGTSQGLISNDIQSLALDRKNGYLWVGTDQGVSRYSIGYSVIPQNNAAPFVYPNPFSKHRHQSIVFENLPPASKVCIYTLAGTLVAVAPVVGQSTSGSECAWTPPAGIVTGIYFYTIQAAGNSSRGRLIIMP